MICDYCYYYSKDREECDFNFDIVSDYLPPCCREDEYMTGGDENGK